MGEISYLMGFCCVLLILAPIGHGVWVLTRTLLEAIFGSAHREKPEPRSRSCPGCRDSIRENAEFCPSCGLRLEGQLARHLNRLRQAQREVRAMADREELDRETAEQVAARLETRIRALCEGEEVSPARPRLRAMPVDELPAQTTSPRDLSPIEALPVEASVVEAEVLASVPESPTPRHGVLAAFMEEKNILWGELVGGVLIVGCSIALVLTLWRDLQDLPYSSFFLAAAITAALFGAGQYTLHHWKLAATSRGLLVIALLLVPLNLLVLADPGVGATSSAIDLAIKIAAILAFVGMVRTAGRDLIGTDLLPGPIDRRWLLSLAVVGAPATQIIPVESDAFLHVWLPLVCQAIASGALLGGLTWYGRRPESPIPADRQAASVLMFIGMSLYALFAAWGWLLTRSPDRLGTLQELAFPLAVAGVPVIEAGLFVQRRAGTHAGLKTTGTGAALLGALLLATGVTLAWPDPLWVTLTAALSGLAFMRVAWRQSLPWFHAGAVPALGYAAVLAVHGCTGNWAIPEGIAPGHWLQELLGTSLSGIALTAFGALLALASEPIVRFGNRPQAVAHAFGGLFAAGVGLYLVSVNGPHDPWPAVGTSAACAVGLLAANVRWRMRPLAEAGGLLLVVATLWTLHAAAHAERPWWGLAIASEALAFAFTALAVTPLAARPGRVGSLVRQYRGAAANAAVAAGLIAVFLTLAAPDFPVGKLHAAAFLLLVPAGLFLTRVFAHSWPTWVASAALLVGLGHLLDHTFEVKPTVAVLLLTLLSHATMVLLGSLAFRRKRSLVRLFGDPLRFSARITTILAVPFLFVPANGLTLHWAGCAVWLAALWFLMAWIWREVAAFSAMHAALAVAAVLGGLSWVEQQSWWETTRLGFEDPRALQAFGVALAILGLLTIVVRRLAAQSERLSALWQGDPLSTDRLILGAVVIGQLVLLALSIAPFVTAELTPLGRMPGSQPSEELALAFGTGTWLLLGLLTVGLVAALRLAPFDDRWADAMLIGLVVLACGAAIAGAGAFAPEVAAASALRWNLAIAFILGSALLYVRTHIARFARSLGFAVLGSGVASVASYVILASVASVVVLLTMNLAETGLRGLVPSGPAEGSIFAAMGWTSSTVVPLALIIIGLSATAVRQQFAGYAFAAGGVFTLTVAGGYALAVVAGGGTLDATVQMRIAMLAVGSMAAWALLWLAVERWVPGEALLTAQSLAGLLGFALIAVVPLARLFANPTTPLPHFYSEFGQFGWFVLALAAWAAFERVARVMPLARAHVVGFVAVAIGILAACAVQPLDDAGKSLSFHTLTLVWAIAGLALTAATFAIPVASRGSWVVALSIGIAAAAISGPTPDAGRWLVPVLLAGYVLLAAILVATLGRKSEESVEDRHRWGSLIAAQTILSVSALVFGVIAALGEPTLGERLAGAFSVVFLAVACGLVSHRSPVEWSVQLRPASLVVAAIGLALVGWAVPEPDSPALWLQRNGWAFVALMVGAFVCLEGLSRIAPASKWAADARRVGGPLALVALVWLGVVLIQEVPVFDPVAKRTPLGIGEVLAILAGIAAMTALALRFALHAESDPLGLPASRRTSYVYLAEVLIVGFFIHVRLNLPELFPPQAGRFWTFLVMVFAFVGIGSAEWFERKRLLVLAVPLRRTGALLPLIPLVAFWAKPPAFLLAWADGTAPGARPFLGYLEKLPQHFDNYASLWFLAGLLYGLVALSRQSFGWALLAALAANAGMWALLAHNDVSAAVHPQIWVIPLALIVLASEQMHRRSLKPRLSAGLRYLGIGMLYLSSSADMFIAGVGESLWLPVILAVFCVGGIFAGIMLRVQAFLFLGIGFLFLDVFAMIWHAAVDRSQTWVWYVSGIVLGVAILALFALFEKRRNDVHGLVDRLRRWD